MAMDVDELEAKIKKEKEALGKLEDLYEAEEDEKKCVKLEYRIDRKAEQINKYIDRQDVLLDREEKDGEKDKPKDKPAAEEDKDVCESCGGDLVFVEMSDEGGIFECEQCKELYLDN